jgi:hypothetical protein
VDLRQTSPTREPYVFRRARRASWHLADGTDWRVVKVMYEPDEVNAVLEADGWIPQIDAGRWFVHGSAAGA